MKLYFHPAHRQITVKENKVAFGLHSNNFKGAFNHFINISPDDIMIRCENARAIELVFKYSFQNTSQ